MGWRAGGDGKAVFFPELPWKKEPQHSTTIVVQPVLEGWMASHGETYYFTCCCGYCGPGRPTRALAVADADAHLEATP